jgi:hypothetical protein
MSQPCPTFHAIRNECQVSAAKTLMILVIGIFGPKTLNQPLKEILQ